MALWTSLNRVALSFVCIHLYSNIAHPLPKHSITNCTCYINHWNHYQNSANARSVSENSIHDGQNNQLVSNNRHQNSKFVQTPPPATNQNRCQSGWMWFNNKCWVTTQSRRDFTHAIELCKKMYNSTLPTIHTEEENEFLRQNIDLHNSPIWLFARHNHQYNKTRWLDKSPVNYTRWDLGQPSDKSSLICIKTEDSWYMKKAEPVDGQTECVSFWEDAKWGTQVGCLVLLPVVCEKKLTPISRLTEGPNGSITSQFEQQQMYPSSATSFINTSGVIYMTLIALISTTMILNQSTSALKQKYRFYLLLT